MKKIFFYLLFLSSTGFVIFFSCQREIKWDINKPPIAIAGPDQVITLPTDSVLLDGNRSSDPDEKISEWLWTKISGPGSFNIIKSSDSITKVKTLVVGTYQFELKVTDNCGLSAKDTVQVIVNDLSIPNRPPVANAGADQTITLPTNAVNLDGSGSTDPDNNITSYSWLKISGPSSFNITNTNAPKTQVNNLVQGNYQFELKVTDARGLLSKDTVRVAVIQPPPTPLCGDSTRPHVNAQLIPFGTLSQARPVMAVASAGNKIVFAGGYNPQTLHSSRVDIYDLATQTWSTAELSVGRHSIAAIAAGNKIFFGGGEIGDGTEPVNTVDIYDVSTNTSSVSSLSEEGKNIGAATVGNKVFFAGGNGGNSSSSRQRQVDIYDLTANAWSTALLSEDNFAPTSVSANNKIYFVGGSVLNNIWSASDRIDIYNNNTNTWSTSSLVEGKIACAGIAVGDKIYWAGGWSGTNSYGTCTVEIKDVNTGNSSMSNLFRPNWFSIDAGNNAVVKDNNIVFLNNNKFDIYNITTDTWSIGVLPVNISEASIISVNNTIYVAGGYVNGVLSSQVWKLEF